MGTETEHFEIEILAQPGAELPTYGSKGAAGADVRAHLPDPLIIPAGKSALVPTGLRMAIPEGYEVQIRPRSGLALKEQITVLNTPGTIDSDYRGEVGVILINHGTKDFVVTNGLRIAQLVVAPVCHVHFTLASQLDTTVRGDGGFGHTGRH